VRADCVLDWHVGVEKKYHTKKTRPFQVHMPLGLSLRELGLTRVGSCAAVTQWMSAVGRGLVPARARARAAVPQGPVRTRLLPRGLVCAPPPLPLLMLI
jgi:hypothetical protein